MNQTRMMNGIKFEMLEDKTVIAHGSKGELYKVTLAGEGSEDSCSCLGWLHRMGRKEGSRDCKHVLAARILARRAADPLPEVVPIAEYKRMTKADIIASLDDGMTVDEEVNLLMAEAEARKHGA